MSKIMRIKLLILLVLFAIQFTTVHAGYRITDEELSRFQAFSKVLDESVSVDAASGVAHFDLRANFHDLPITAETKRAIAKLVELYVEDTPNAADNELGLTKEEFATNRALLICEGVRINYLQRLENHAHFANSYKAQYVLRLITKPTKHFLIEDIDPGYLADIESGPGSSVSLFGDSPSSSQVVPNPHRSSRRAGQTSSRRPKGSPVAMSIRGKAKQLDSPPKEDKQKESKPAKAPSPKTPVSRSNSFRNRPAPGSAMAQPAENKKLSGSVRGSSVRRNNNIRKP